jgi:hypothetical protein
VACPPRLEAAARAATAAGAVAVGAVEAVAGVAGKEALVEASVEAEETLVVAEKVGRAPFQQITSNEEAQVEKGVC